jgi:hypothetical protein
MADNLPDPGGGRSRCESGPGSSSDSDINEEDLKFMANNSKIVVLPDRRLCSLLHEDDDDQSSTGTSVHGDGLDELEYEYEPGISLQSLEFGRQSEEPQFPDLSASTNSPRNSRLISRCPHCGVDYESGRRLNTLFIF